MFRRKRIVAAGADMSQFATKISSAAVDKYIKYYSNLVNNKEEKLAIYDDDVREDWTTLHFAKDKEPDILADIRYLFVPILVDHKDEVYPDLKKLTYLKYKLVLAKFVFERIEWIHHCLLLDTLYNLLDDGGVICVISKNFEFLANLYIRCREKQRKHNHTFVRFPFDDHPGLGERRSIDVQRWFNFQLYSGESISHYSDGAIDGDFKRSCVDAFMLANYFCLSTADRRFVNVKYSVSDVVKLIAVKPAVETLTENYNEMTENFI